MLSALLILLLFMELVKTTGRNLIENVLSYQHQVRTFNVMWYYKEAASFFSTISKL
jgi:hypothetical protein